MQFIPLIAFILLAATPHHAAAEEEARPPLAESPARKNENTRGDGFLTIAFENDSIGRGTDQHYTNGVRLTYFDLNADFPGIAHKIAKSVPTFSINEQSSIYYSLGHNLYTPDDIESRAQDPDDRPWAGFLYGSAGMATLTDNHIDELEAMIGLVGPLAMGEELQKFIHNHVTDSPSPKGWSNQLENEPGLLLSWQRRWPRAAVYKSDFFQVSATPHIGATIGNIYTYGNAGITFRISEAGSKWEDTPMRVRPALPGTGYFEPQDDGLGWYIFGGIEGRAVARNLFLDGNTFEDSHSVDKFPFTGDANLGLALTYGRTRLSYTLVHRAKEFEGQDRADLFGALSVAYRF